MAKTKVKIANGWEDPSTGKTYKAEETAEVEPSVARDLIHRGKARPLPADAEKSAEKSNSNSVEPPKTDTKRGNKEATA